MGWCSGQLYDSICDEGACEVFFFFFFWVYIALADFVQVASLAREELKKKRQVWVFVELVEHGDDIPS